MFQKKILRKKYYELRKKKYYEIESEFFLPLVDFLKLNKRNKYKIALYYPSNFEINVLKFLENKFIKTQTTSLPVIEKNEQMNFYLWKKNQVLLVNKYGILEPFKTKINIPDVILVPLLSFDKEKYRLGYGKGFYDRYLSKYIKKFKNIITVGVAFSFQKHHKLPKENNDIQLNYILTEKGIY